MSSTYKSKLRSASRAKLEATNSGNDSEDNSNPTNTSTDDLTSSDHINNDPQTLLPSPRTPPITDLGETPEYPDLDAFFPPSPYGRRRQQIYGDRFIPLRDEHNFVRDYHLLDSPSSGSRNPYADPEYHSETRHRQRRLSAFFRAEIMGDTSAADEYTMPDGVRQPRRVFHYSNSHQFRRSPSPSLEPSSSPRYQASRFGDAGLRILSAPHRPARHISRTAIKILDAPELQDDFYLNLVDWGNNDCLAVGLGSCVYLWNANTSRVTKLCDFVNDAISSVSWAKQGSHLAIGTNKGTVFLWDTETSRRIRTWTGHTSRTGALAWSSNILTSGSRDHKIYHRDVRSPNQYFRKLDEHVQEVCGLKWNEEGTMLASGGNDNNLLIWNSHQDNLLWKFRDHTAAVKAIGWSPHTRGMLASGGGTADKTIKFWNAISGAAISSHDTGSQVCNIAWSKKTNEIVSTHGYASNSDSSSNQVIVWRANNMQRVATLSGHSSRVLYMSLSHDGTTVVTGAGDETLRFWDVFSTAEVIRREPEDRRECLR